MLEFNADPSLGELEQCGSAGQGLKVMEVDNDQATPAVIQMMDELWVLCQAWGIDPVEADDRFVFDDTRETLGRIYGMAAAMYIWSHEMVGPVADPGSGH